MDGGEKGFFWEILEGKIKPSPARQLLGWKLLALDTDGGYIKVEFQARHEFLNPVGKVQGGLLSAMLDNTVGPLVAAKLEAGKFATTLELKTSFIKPADMGCLIGEGFIVSYGRTICYTEAQLKDPEGDLVAKASATMLIVDYS